MWFSQHLTAVFVCCGAADTVIQPLFLALPGHACAVGLTTVLAVFVAQSPRRQHCQHTLLSMVAFFVGVAPLEAGVLVMHLVAEGYDIEAGYGGATLPFAIVAVRVANVLVVCSRGSRGLLFLRGCRCPLCASTVGLDCSTSITHEHLHRKKPARFLGGLQTTPPCAVFREVRVYPRVAMWQGLISYDAVMQSTGGVAHFCAAAHRCRGCSTPAESPHHPACECR